MRVYGLFILMLFSLPIFAEEGQRTLVEAVNDYEALQKSIDALLKIKSPECLPGTKLDPTKTYCSIKDICSRPDIDIDAPLYYQNAKGESVVNDTYYSLREEVRACLKEKYSDEIESKRDELTKKLGAAHLQKIIAANKKLNQLADKYNQGAKLQKISSEVLNMSLEDGINEDESDWEKPGTDRSDLILYLNTAEKRTKIVLNLEIKKTLVEIQYLKKNATYPEQVKKFEEALIPKIKISNPLYNWDLLLDEKEAGGLKALAANRAMLTQKTQEGYTLFQDTQKELIAYLESKKTESNRDKVDRNIARVRSIRFNPPRLTARVKDLCKDPNAYYFPSDHSFLICPQMLGFPKMSLMETMAHEMSHSFDSCNFSGKLYKTKGPSVVAEAPFEIEIKTDDMGGNYTNVFYDDSKMDDKNKIQDKMKYADNPFVKTLSCLQSDRSVGAKAADPQTLFQKNKTALDELTRLGQNTPNNPKARYLNFLKDNEKDYFDYLQGCDYGDPKENGGVVGSQMAEAFADKLASEIVARKIKKLSKVEAEKAMTEIAIGYGDICADDGKAIVKLRDYAVKEGCKEFYGNLTTEERLLKGISLSDPKTTKHPNTVARIERNLMAHPAVREVLKCPIDKGVKYCE